MKHISGKVQDFIADLVRGKNVLDVGCVDHSANVEAEDTWLHKHVLRTARSVVGLDLLETEAAKLNAKGYNIRSGDACTVFLGETFDVIVAGELIEHVDSSAAFLSNMSRHLNHHGRLVLTTPNAFFFLHFLESIFTDVSKRWNPEHVAWYDPFTLRNLMTRCGLEVESCYYFTRSRKLQRVLGALHIPVYGVVASSILMIARRKEPASANG